jgi:hypothetical protein
MLQKIQNTALILTISGLPVAVITAAKLNLEIFNDLKTGCLILAGLGILYMAENSGTKNEFRNEDFS